MKAMIPAALLLAGCASAPVPHIYLGHDHRGAELTVHYSLYTSTFALVDCPRLAALHGASDGDVLWLALQLPIACAYRGPRGAIMVLPPDAPAWMLEHELSHFEDPPKETK